MLKRLTTVLPILCVFASSKLCLASDPGELTQNGGFEAGDTGGWQYFPSEFSDFHVTLNSYSGAFAAELYNPSPNSSAVIKQANLAAGAVNPGDTLVISFAAKITGSTDAVAFAEFFSEIRGGGTSSAEILGGGALPLTGGWQTFQFLATAGPDVSGGVTLQFAAVTGFDAWSFIDLFIDEASVRTAVVPGINYCEAAPNSVSATGAQISASGSTDVFANDLVLTAGPIQPGQFGLFYHGAVKAQIPFGEGFRCVASQIVRINPPVLADSTGFATELVDNDGAGGAFITAGVTRHFQFWYRDPAGGDVNGDGIWDEFSLSDGLELCFY